LYVCNWLKFRFAAKQHSTAQSVYALGVVEQPAVPEVVEAARVVVEEAAVGAVELVQSVDGVLAGVAVNDVQKHHDPTTMRHVNQLLQLVRCPVPTTAHTHTQANGHKCVSGKPIAKLRSVT